MGYSQTNLATLGGARQYVSVRGADRRNPILIYIHGGPASVALPIEEPGHMLEALITSVRPLAGKIDSR